MPTRRNLPIDHISYSMVRLFLEDRYKFHKRYVQNIKEDSHSPSSLVGSAFHKFLEYKYKGFREDQAKEQAHIFLHDFEHLVDWGKSGSPEKALAELNTLVENFLREEPDIGKVVAVEKRLTAAPKKWPLPLTCATDLLAQADDGLVVMDWKRVTSYDSKPTAWHKLQAVVNSVCVLAEYGESPVRVVFVQCKAARNSDGSPQIRFLPLTHAEIAYFEPAMRGIVKDMCRELARKRMVFFPNPSNMFGGEESFNEYITQFTPKKIFTLSNTLNPQPLSV